LIRDRVGQQWTTPLFPPIVTGPATEPAPNLRRDRCNRASMAFDDPKPLLEQQIPALRRYAYALTRDHDAADDLVQDCLERALSRWLFRRAGGDVSAWLFTILRNLHIDGCRARRRRGVHAPIEDALGLSTPADEEGALDARDALAALDRLPEDQKSILLLIAVEDLSYEEVSRMLGVPLGTVMSRLSRARQRLRSILESGRSTLLRRVK
jgi:RNA polymerase sigma factor (sigma-70 family)